MYLFYRLHNWVYKWQDAERRRIIDNQRPNQLIILLDYANRYTHWQQDGACCKHDRQSSHLVVYVLSAPSYYTSATIKKKGKCMIVYTYYVVSACCQSPSSRWFTYLGHRCEVWTFWNSDPKQTPECVHAALREIVSTEMKKADKRGTPISEVILFSDRCGEQFSGRKNFRMCSETATLLAVVLLWIFACPHHFAGVWDAWGGTESRLLKNVEINGHETIRTAIDCVVKLRELRSDLITTNNERGVRTQCADTNEDADTNEGSDTDTCDEDSDTSDVCENFDDDEADLRSATNKKFFKADGCHVRLLQLCMCRSAASCTCVPDSRVKDTHHILPSW